VAEATNKAIASVENHASTYLLIIKCFGTWNRSMILVFQDTI
jgi:hypothetical protein